MNVMPRIEALLNFLTENAEGRTENSDSSTGTPATRNAGSCGAAC